MNDQPLTGQDSIYASATIDQQAHKILLKIVNASAKAVNYKLALDGVVTTKDVSTQQVLTAKNKGDFNTLDSPAVVKPVEQQLKPGKNNVDVVAAANSLNVITIPYR